MFLSRENTTRLGFGIKHFFLSITILVFFMFVFSIMQIEAQGLEKAPSTDNNYDNLKTFSEVLSLIESTYVENVSSKKIIEGAIHGLVKTLDPHSSYLPPEAYKEMKVQTSGKFGGLGIEVSTRNGILTVISPIEGTPAFEAGVQAKDKIVKIEEESTLDMDLAEAVSLLCGEIGTEVNIRLLVGALEAP